MKEKNIVIYKSNIPIDLIESFESVLLKCDPHSDIAKKEEDIELGILSPEESEIVIYISNHLYEVIAGGLLMPFVYDTLKGGIKVLWKGLSKLKQRQDTNKNKKPPKISLRFKINEGGINMEFEGKATEEQAESIVKKAFDFISNDNLKELLKNPDYLQNKHKAPVIKLKYNKKKQSWEPIKRKN